MDKKVLIISSSPRKGGNSETLAAAFAKGARETGNPVETVYLREKQVGFCKGCLACLNLGHCVIQDDAVEIAAKMHDANVLVFATPVYYYCVSGQLKTMLDRANPLFDEKSIGQGDSAGNGSAPCRAPPCCRAGDTGTADDTFRQLASAPSRHRDDGR